MQDRQRTEITAGQAAFCFAGLVVGGFIKGGEGAWYGVAIAIVTTWAVYHSPFATQLRKGLGEIASFGFILIAVLIAISAVLAPASCSGNGGYEKYRAP